MTTTKTRFQTPMMIQYMRIKEDYKDCILFFRMGDFYELFLEDAKIGSKLLDITLTARHKGKDKEIPMCGVPYHAIDVYLAKIVKAGYKAAICEQISENTDSKIVERDVVRIVSPGTITDEKLLTNKTNNFILTLHIKDTVATLSYADISTGEFYYLDLKANTTDKLTEQILPEILKINPSEIILPKILYENTRLLKALKQSSNINIFKLDEAIDLVNGIDSIKRFFNIKSLSIFSIEENNETTIVSIANLLNYLINTQKGQLFHIKKITNTSKQSYLKLDINTINNLEVFSASQTTYTRSKKASLVDNIDKTQTPMGGRYLRGLLLKPLLDDVQINKNLNIVGELINKHECRELLNNTLQHINDIERILSRIGTKNCSGRDVVSLKISCNHSIQVLKIILETKFLSSYFQDMQIKELMDDISKLSAHIDSKLVDEPPISIREGKMIKPGASKTLDTLNDSIKDSRVWLAELEVKEKESTNINSLKVGFNSVFGYYIEVRKTHSDKVPTHYVRKQTLVNAERYITEELKIKEEVVLNTQDKINELEYSIFNNLIDEIIPKSSELQNISKIVAKIDCFVGYATLAIENSLVKPTIRSSSKYNIQIDNGRHIVVEKFLDNEPFTPNDTVLNKQNFLHLITGPNMAGKSTYIRQVALIQIMAQIGCFVPASKCELSVVDSIYTRIGAGDALAQGLSTFMVEMIETAKILQNATDKSLVILDEIGRGTSTIDGLSIAKAVVEYIHNKVKCKTLFATHFHELVNLEQRLKGFKNYSIKVVEKDKRIHFLHKLVQGGTNKSYGIEVAKLAGLPKEVIDRATKILNSNSSSQIGFDL